MDNIVICMSTIVSTNSSRLGIRGFCRTYQLSYQGNAIVSLPCHGNYGTTGNIIH